MEVDAKIYLLDKDGEKYMGIGVMWLLERIDKYKSLRAAAKEMGLSYSKALKMITHLEEVEGREFLIRKRGGNKREGAKLTSFANEYILLYNSFQEKCKKSVNKEFLLYKEEYEKLKERSNGKD